MLAAGDERGEDSGPSACSLAANEEPVLAADGNGTHGTFGEVVVD